MDDWESECCGSEVNVGDRVEWMIYANAERPLEPTEEEPHITTIPNDEVEIVGKWVPKPYEGSVFGDLTEGWRHVGVTLLSDQHPQGSAVKYRGKIWRELHSVEMAAWNGVVRGIYYHPAKLEPILGGWQSIGFDDGRTVMSTVEVGMDISWAFRFLVEVDL